MGHAIRRARAAGLPAQPPKVHRELVERVLGLVPRPSMCSPFGPRAQADHSSVLRIAGSISRGPQTTPLSCRLDGLAAIASSEPSRTHATVLFGLEDVDGA